MNPFLEAALAYQRAGLHVMPVEVRGKRPILATWRRYVERQPTEAEVRQWWAETPEANIALLMGRGTFVVDVDGPEGERALAESGIELPADAPMVLTGKGRHVFLSGQAPNAVGVLPKVDTRSDGGYVVAPPSVHPSGATYRWAVYSFDDPMPPAPGPLLELLARPTKPGAGAPAPGAESVEDWVSVALRGVGEGQRDNTCTRLAGYFWGRGLSQATVESILEGFADRCSPPFPYADVAKCVESICRRDGGPGPDEDAPEGGAAIVAFVERLLKPDPPKRVVPTGLAQLDDALNGGLYPGQLTYFAGIGGVGKSITAQALAIQTAEVYQPVLYVTLEMPESDVMVRLLSHYMFVDSRRLLAILHGQLKADDQDKRRLRGVLGQVRDLPITFRQSLHTIESIDRTLTLRPDIRLLVVDQVHHLRRPDGTTGIQGLEANSRELVQLAGKHDLPVVGLCQVNRPDSKERQRGWRPTRYSLRGSEQLYHDPAVVLLFHRTDETPDRIEIQVAKGRMGGASDSWMTFAYKPEICRVGD